MTVLLFGCPRSGTTILGELFEHINGWQFYLEPTVARVKLLKHQRWNWAVKNPIGEQPWTPGLPCDLDDLLASVPDPQIVFIIRHPLDTICSLRPGMTAGWEHGPIPPDAPKDPLERSAAVWEWVNHDGYDNICQRQEPYVIRFEDLVRAPQLQTVRLINHLGIEITAVQLAEYASLIEDRTGGYEAKHQDRYVTDDHTHRIGRWVLQLEPEEVARCWDLVGPTAKRFGYEN